MEEDDYTITDVSEGITYSDKVEDKFELYRKKKITLNELKKLMNELVTGIKPLSEIKRKELEKFISDKMDGQLK